MALSLSLGKYLLAFIEARVDRPAVRTFSLAMVLNDLSRVSVDAGIFRRVICEHSNDTWVKIFVRATVFPHFGLDFTI